MIKKNREHHKHEEEWLILNGFLKKNSLKKSHKRDLIVSTFFSIHRHITSKELHALVEKKDSSIGYTTVYRTLKLLCSAGLSKELCFSDGETFYEHLYNHPHHDHLICVSCRSCIEFCDPQIEKIQIDIFEKYCYRPVDHKMELYGVCQKCQKVLPNTELSP